jgi:hypothetical protein
VSKLKIATQAGRHYEECIHGQQQHDDVRTPLRDRARERHRR